MPSTAPTLTWNMTNIRVPATPTDAESVLTTIALCVTDATYWKLDTGAFNSGTGAGYRIFTPVGGNQPNMQVIFVHSPDDDMILDNGDGGNYGNHTNTNKTTTIFIGLCPDGGADSDPLSDPVDSSGERFTKYWKISDRLDQDPWNQVFCLNSDESLAMWGNEVAAEDWYGGIAGAIVDPPVDADGEGTPGRIYGMMVSGNRAIQNAFWNSDALFTATRNGANAEAICIYNPNATTVLVNMQHMSRAVTTAPRYFTVGGTQISMPYAYYEQIAPFNLYGIGRQMRCTTDGLMREIIQDSGANDKSYRIGGSALANGDVVSFDNG
jgi:hypothetical protein